MYIRTFYTDTDHRREIKDLTHHQRVRNRVMFLKILGFSENEIWFLTDII